MTYGILDDNATARLSQDLREADWQDKQGNHDYAAHLRAEVEDLRQLDYEIRKQQALDSGLIKRIEA